MPGSQATSGRLPEHEAHATILLVEDEAILVLAQKTRLASWGYRVEIARDAAEAIEKGTSEEIDLILMDIDLGPDLMDGTVAAQRILEQRFVPIVFLTSHAEAAVVDRVEGISSFGYVLKDSGEFVLRQSIKMAPRLRELSKRQARSEGLYTSLFALAPDSILVVDIATGKLTQANAAAAELFETSIESLIGKHYTSLHPAREHGRAEEAFAYERARGMDPIRPMEIQIETSNGHERTVEIRGTRITLDGVKSILAHIRDVTEKRKIDALLSEERARFESLSKLTFEGILIHRNGRFIDANESFERLSGYSRGELAGMESLRGIIEGSEVPGVREAIRGGMEEPYETQIVRRDGTVLPVEMRPRIVTWNGEEVRVVVVRDLSREKQLAASLKASVADLERAQRIGKIGNWKLEPSTGIAEWSDEIFRIHERDPAEGTFLPGEYQEAYQPEPWPEFEEANRIAIQKGIPYRVRLKLHFPQGRIKWIESIGEPDGEVGSPDFVLRGTLQEITETVMREERLERLVLEKDLLMREVNHRAKNNLAIVQSLIALKESDLGATADLRDVINQVEAVRKVHEELSFETGVQGIEMSAYIGDLLQNVLGSEHRDRVTVVASVPSVIFPARTAVSMGVMINEIATNALKHGLPESGSMEFHLTLSADDEAGSGGESWILTACNTGKPMPPEVNFDSPSSMGHSLIAALVDQMDGSIELMHEPEPTITIRFKTTPIGEPARAAQSPSDRSV